MDFSEKGLPLVPQRIISLVPSQTELLYHLGLDVEVVGITKFCIHPEKWFRNKSRVGGTKNVNIESVRELQPDLVIANKEENTEEQIRAIASFCPVWITDIASLEESLLMITDLGRITGRQAKSNEIAAEISKRFDQLSTAERESAAYLIWKDPYMAAGGDTFINDMLCRCGYENVFSRLSRYPEVSIELLRESQCKTILLSSEPYPFKQKHIEELQTELPAVRIRLVDGEMFSWYGSRLLYAPDYFRSLRLNALN